jgi:hypothetical protein
MGTRWIQSRTSHALFLALGLAALVALFAWAPSGKTTAATAATTGAARDSTPRPAAVSERRRASTRRAQTSPTGSAKLGGTIKSRNGTPIASATVCASCVDCNLAVLENGPRCTRTDALGGYSLDLPGGRYHVSVSADGYAPALVHNSKLLEVASDDALEDLDAELVESTVEVVGMVVDRIGGPVAGATIRANFRAPDATSSGPAVSQTTTSDHDGRFRFNAPPGPVRLIASADGYAPADMSRVAPARHVEMLLSPASTLHGTVVDAVEGTPVAGVRVTARVPLGHERSGLSEADGRFSITALSPGQYHLVAVGPGWHGAYPEPVWLDVVDS